MEQRFVKKSDHVVLDRETGMVWQRSASEDRMVWKDGFTYIDWLNKNQFGGFGDWRYPTREELSTIITSDEDRNTGLFIDPAFGSQRNFWTSTEGGHHQAVYIDFYYGDAYVMEGNYANHFIRAVRSQAQNG